MLLVFSTYILTSTAHLCPVCKQKRFATTSNLYRHSRSCRGARSDFIAVSYGERLLGAPEYGSTVDLTPDPIADPLGNVVARHRMFPTTTHSENFPSYGQDESSLRSGSSITRDSYPASSTTVTAHPPKCEILEDGSLQQPSRSSEFIVADVDGVRNEIPTRSRAPPLFSARPPKPCLESKQDTRPSDICTASSSSDAPLVNMPKPTVSNDPREATVQSLSNTFVLSHEPLYHQFTSPTSASPAFSTFTPDTSLVAPRPIHGASIVPTNLKWADEAKKTRRTTPSQKR